MKETLIQDYETSNVHVCDWSLMSNDSMVQLSMHDLTYLSPNSNSHMQSIKTLESLLHSSLPL